MRLQGIWPSSAPCWQSARAWCQSPALPQQHHRRHAISGKGITAGTIGDAAAQMEAQASRSNHHQGTAIA